GRVLWHQSGPELTDPTDGRRRRCPNPCGCSEPFSVEPCQCRRCCDRWDGHLSRVRLFGPCASGDCARLSCSWGLGPHLFPATPATACYIILLMHGSDHRKAHAGSSSCSTTVLYCSLLCSDMAAAVDANRHIAARPTSRVVCVDTITSRELNARPCIADL